MYLHKIFGCKITALHSHKVDVSAKVLLFFDICKRERDFSLRIMLKEMFSGKTEKTDRYANPEKGVVIVLSLFRSANVVLILC